MKEKLVLIGNGMAGVRTLEELLKLAPAELESDLRKPNPSYLKEKQLPLLERNPLGFWRSLSTLLLLANLVLLYLLAQ